MCEYCKGTGLFYADKGFGIEVKKCPVCEVKDNSYEEFRKELREMERRLRERGA